MAGRVKKLIDEVIELRTEGNPNLKGFVRALLIMKGVNPDKHTDTTPDDPAMIEKLLKIKNEFQRAA